MYLVFVNQKETTVTHPTKLKADDIVVLAFSGDVINKAFADIDKLVTDDTVISNELVEVMGSFWGVMQQGVEPVTPEMIAADEAEDGVME